MTIKNKYEFGDVVYLLTDQTNSPRIVTGMILRPNSKILYYLVCGDIESPHYSIEISKEKGNLHLM